MKVTVVNNSKFIKHVGEITLNIGINEGIKKAEWDKAAKHPIVKGWIKSKDVELKEVNNITDITPATDAIEMVQTTFSQNKLQKWAEQEKRKTVIEAIQVQIEELEKLKTGK